MFFEKRYYYATRPFSNIENTGNSVIVGLPTENRDGLSKLLKGLSGLTWLTKCQRNLGMRLKLWNVTEASSFDFNS